MYIHLQVQRILTYSSTIDKISFRKKKKKEEDEIPSGNKFLILFCKVVVV